MQLPADIRPDERILVLGIPSPDIVSALSCALTHGMVVALGDDDEVRAGRKAAADLRNVMFVPGTPDHIPWQDGFFTRVIDAVGEWPDAGGVAREIRRVTLSGTQS